MNRDKRKGQGILRGVWAFSRTAPGEERYFCYPFDRCVLAPIWRTLSQRSGKDPPPPSDGSVPHLLSGRVAPTSHRAPGLLGIAPVQGPNPISAGHGLWRLHPLQTFVPGRRHPRSRISIYRCYKVFGPGESGAPLRCVFWRPRTGVMHDFAYVLRRITILRTPVNRDRTHFYG